MEGCDIAQTMRLIGNAFERRQCACQRRHKFRGFRKLAVVQSDARIGTMQIGLLTAAVLFELRAERMERVCEAIAAGTRARAAQHCALKRSDGTVAVRHTKTQQRMLEQREQRHRSKLAERRFRSKPCKYSR